MKYRQALSPSSSKNCAVPALTNNHKMVYIVIMERVKFLFTLLLLLFIAVSCGSGAKTSETPAEAGESGSVEPASAGFDPDAVTKEHYDSTMTDVRNFIEGLNQLIKSRNYSEWKASLSPEYFAEISSPDNLKRISEQPAMKTRRLVLKAAEDYFIHVVVPSRADLHVDDIEFIGSNRVKVFSITTNNAGETVRLRLYDLEKTNNVWKIIN